MTQFFKFLLLFSFSFSTPSFASFFEMNSDPDTVKVSLLTVGIGGELEASYGHTILRVNDDLINWGMFDFNQPYFVPNFLRGLLRYFADISSYNSTIRKFDYEKRSVVEDTIVLTKLQKEKLLKILNHRLQPENIYFWYDFFFYNCSTIPRDILNEVLGGEIKNIYEKVPASLNLRGYVRQNLDQVSAVSFFLDIMLNSDVDGPVSAWVEMFYPIKLQHYLNELPQFDDAGNAIPGTHLLTEHHQIVEGGTYPPSPLNIFYIFFIVGFLLLGTHIFFLWKRNAKAQDLLAVASLLWGSISGFIGCVLLAGWLFSKHHMLYHNANLFVFFPLDFVFVHFAYKLWKNAEFKKTQYKFYFTYLCSHLVCLCFFLLAYVSGYFVQDVSNVGKFMAPIAGLLFLACIKRIRS